jgi:hypothetical protein
MADLVDGSRLVVDTDPAYQAIRPLVEVQTSFDAVGMHHIEGLGSS